MKTLLFTTSYCTDESVWINRIFKWFKHYSFSGLVYDKLLILDDKSPIILPHKDIELMDKFSPVELNCKNCLISFEDHLGRPGMLDYPGWFRSFAFAATYAKKFNYQKIIHIKSDAYLISDRIIQYFNQLNTGWNVLWCSRHSFPETAFQVIGPNQVDNYFNILQKPYEIFKNKPIEHLLPFTNVITSFKGDRYLEYRPDIPEDADYAAQGI